MREVLERGRRGSERKHTKKHGRTEVEENKIKMMGKEKSKAVEKLVCG